MKILVTGNLGYLGTVLTPFLVRQSHEVHGVDNGMASATVINEFPSDSPIQHKLVSELTGLENFDIVYHLAAISNDPMGEINEEFTFNVNVGIPKKLVDLYPNARHVLASSASVYGAIPNTDVADESYKLNPLTAYARSKVAAEEVVRKAESYSILRMGTLWGHSPNMRRDIVVNAFCWEAIHSGEIKPKAKARRPILHVVDAAYAMIAAGFNPDALGKTLNVSSENTTVQDIADAVAAVTDTKVSMSPEITPDARDYAMDSSKYLKLVKNINHQRVLADRYQIYEIVYDAKHLGPEYPTRLEQLCLWLDNLPS
jgi:nucleoside-diphosphate-sugar epimerase